MASILSLCQLQILTKLPLRTSVTFCWLTVYGDRGGLVHTEWSWLWNKSYPCLLRKHTPRDRTWHCLTVNRHLTYIPLVFPCPILFRRYMERKRRINWNVSVNRGIQVYMSAGCVWHISTNYGSWMISYIAYMFLCLANLYKSMILHQVEPMFLSYPLK